MDRQAALDPVEATFSGIAGFDREMTDYSPDGHDARTALARDTLAELATLADESEADRLARAYVTERLDTAIRLHEAGAHLCDLNILASPLQTVRDVFDVTKGAEAIEARLNGVEAALAGWQASLREGVANGKLAARYQALRCAEQAERRCGYFAGFASAHPAAAASAAEAFAATARWLRDWYAPRAAADDAVGAERYRLYAQAFLGADLSVADTYEWGWSEVRRLDAELRRTAEQVVPGATLAEVFRYLDAESPFAVVGIDALAGWAQDYVDATIDAFGAHHFDIAEPLRRCTVNIAPGGGAASPYYMPPSEDWSRAGGVWYPDLGADRRYPLWGHVTTAHHEAVPGHHLQVAQTLYRSERLSRFQRLSFVSGHGEGWALYAERLCEELGLLSRPEAVLGFLAAQQLRAVRVVIDIGLHTGRAIPTDSPFHPGERWSRPIAVAFAHAATGEALDVIESEVDRYLGWPGQAISYKVGEREWLAAREDARRLSAAAGRTFDLKAFHTAALDLGPIGLDGLRREVTRAFAVAA